VPPRGTGFSSRARSRAARTAALVCHPKIDFGKFGAKVAMYPYGMGRPRDHTDVAPDLSRELADLAAQLASLKGEANAWLSDESYDILKHHLEDAHAAVEAAAVEARRRVRLNEGRER
jgi:hypothetical protein